MKNINYKNKPLLIITLAFLLIIGMAGCKKLTEVETPVTNVNAANIFAVDATAASVLTGIYIQMSADNANITNGGISSLSVFLGLAADELKLFDLNNARLLSYYRNSLDNRLSPDYWSTFYSVIFIANTAIEGLTGSDKLTPVVRQQLIGEAKFIRAFCYFYLVNLYGKVPLALSSDWKVNSMLPRASDSLIYQQIIKDLKEAQTLLSSKYLQGDALTAYGSLEERTRPTKAAATALLARTYLYSGDWVNAEAEASAVINNSNQYALESIVNAFKKNNKEAIWQLQPVYSGTQANTGDGRLFVLPLTGPNSTSNPVYMNNNLVNSFEAGDKRRINWVDSIKLTSTVFYFPSKYKIGSVTTSVQEYSTILRLAELYLIRAEARAQQNKISDAQADLNMLRTRAGLLNTTASDKSTLLSAILHERQVELFTEWGHRWLDLKRTNTINAVMNNITPQKGGTWNSNWQWFPISFNELQLNPNLVQNKDY